MLDQIIYIFEILLGLYWVWSGINGFFNFIPPPPPSQNGLAFLEALEKSRFILPSIKSFEITAGVLLMFHVSPLALLVLMPILFGIVGFHFVVNQRQKLFSLILIMPHLGLFLFYLPIYAKLLRTGL